MNKQNVVLVFEELDRLNRRVDLFVDMVKVAIPKVVLDNQRLMVEQSVATVATLVEEHRQDLFENSIENS